MDRTSRFKPVLLTLLCVMLLVARVDGAHWHLCFDGKESPASLHLFDVGPHHGGLPAASAAHHDTDVALSADVLSKSGKWPLGLDYTPALIAVAFLLVLLNPARGYTPPIFGRAAAVAPFYLHPPSRGPPR